MDFVCDATENDSMTVDTASLLTVSFEMFSNYNIITLLKFGMLLNVRTLWKY